MFNARIPAVLQPFFGYETKKQKSSESVQLTQAELQRLSAVLKVHAKVTAEVLQELKQESSVFWNLSDKTNPNTATYYENFCQLNSTKKKARQHLAKIEALQGKVKRILKG